LSNFAVLGRFVPYISLWLFSIHDHAVSQIREVSNANLSLNNWITMYIFSINFEGSQGNYAGMCQTVQSVLLQSCDTLVNPDGSLTSAGTSALECIRNGIVLDGGAALLGVPLHVVLAGLSILATPTGFGGIVDMSGFNRLSNIGSIGSLLSQLP
jgi:hypothetical protein